ncbi:septum site-determining protein MinC [Niveibacterium sp. 24ML]|nr:septum site-determining protein MinC [Niveibacterium sp. 24ML]
MQANRNNGKTIEFKGGTLQAMTAVVRDPNVMKLADAMHAMLGGMGEFFAGEPTIIDLSGAALPERMDWSGLASLLRRYGLQPVAVQGIPEAYGDGARKAGLAVLNSDTLKTAPETSPKKVPSAASAISPEATPAAQVAAPAHEPATRTMVIDRPLRSGQQVYARGGDLVVLGGVSNGAEVIADGNIHCYGPLRGRALAGAQGDQTARIFTTSLGAELVSIAGVFRTFERGLPEEVAGRAALITLTGSGDKAQLRLDPLQLG